MTERKEFVLPERDHLGPSRQSALELLWDTQARICEGVQGLMLFTAT
jgi:hypothetical protein